MAERKRLLPVVVAAGVLAMVAGCSTSAIDPEAAATPPTARARAIVGDIDSGKPEWRRPAKRFRSDLTEALGDSGQFTSVTARIAEKPVASDLVISGAFVEIDPGSEVGRGVLGFGAGKPTLKAWFQVADASGKVLFRFEQEARPGGGGGFDAHWDPIVLDDEIRLFAGETAAAIVEWLEQPPPAERRPRAKASGPPA